MTNQSRRSFLQGSIVGAAALASASVVQAAPRSKVPAEWDETVDVIVVGSGFAGLAAATEARKAGAKSRRSREDADPGRQLHHQWRHSDRHGLPATAQARHQGLRRPARSGHPRCRRSTSTTPRRFASSPNMPSPTMNGR
ncbi:MAG: FAD-binding protein [Sutterella wadsworthensis]